MSLTKFVHVISASVLIIICRYANATSSKCLTQPRIEYGSVEVDGNSAKIKCDPNYTLYGHDRLYCYTIYGKGQWIYEYDQPVCVTNEPKCSNLKHIPNGRVVMLRDYHNATAKFVCNSGYKLNAKDWIFCNSTVNKWNRSPPQCIDKTSPLTNEQTNSKTPYLKYFTLICAIVVINILATAVTVKVMKRRRKTVVCGVNT